MRRTRTEPEPGFYKYWQGMALDPEQLRLTDFLDLSTLQEIQDSFTAVAGVKALIADAEGNILTQSAPSAEFLAPPARAGR